VRCVLFRHKAQFADIQLRDGLQVEVRALATIYEARGEFQLNVEAVRLAGVGALYEAFARLKAKLDGLGWFDAARKRPLPAFARRVGIVTSTRAAALHDVLTTLGRRMPALPVIVYPCSVQGRGAGDEIAAAIRTANARRETDVLIVCRGGGSIEDLWAFNEEIVAQAVFDSAIPVVSGVGHETDFTICDFVADARAPTPTAAAALVAPDRKELDVRARGAFLRVRSAALRALEQRMQKVDNLARHLRHPAARLADQRQALAQLHARLRFAWRVQGERAYSPVQNFSRRYRQRLQAPLPQGTVFEAARSRLTRVAAARLQVLSERIAAGARALAHLNPEAVLERGYSIVTHADGSVVHSARTVAVDESLDLRFAQGSARARVERKTD
jgi:exodeoxyribonuclease VII large subunit